MKTEYLFLIVAGEGDLNVANALNMILIAAASSPTTTTLQATICGYDTDARELWQIPEVRAFLRELDTRLPKTVKERLDAGFRSLLTVATHDQWDIHLDPDTGVYTFRLPKNQP